MRSRRAWNPAQYTQVSFLAKGDAVQEMAKMLEYIGQTGAPGHSFAIVVDPEVAENRKEFSFDGDGADDLREVKVDGKSLRRSASLQPLRSRSDYGADDNLNKPQAWTDKKLKKLTDAIPSENDGFVRPFWQNSGPLVLDGGLQRTRAAVALVAIAKELLEGED